MNHKSTRLSLFLSLLAMLLPMSAFADPLRVTLRSSGDHLLAHFQLPSDATTFEFFEDPMPPAQRAADWHIAGDGWSFDGQRLTRNDGQAFAEFEVEIRPASQLYDRKYVPAAAIGTGGWLVFANTFAPKGADHVIRIAGLPDDHVVVGQGALQPADGQFNGAELGLFYFGPGSYVTASGGLLVAGPEVPAKLRQDIAQHLAEAVSTLEAAWDIKAEPAPVVMITSKQDWNGRSRKGGVLGQTITFHFRGYDLDAMDSQFAANIRNTVLHEAVHIWNGTLYSSSENAEQSWVHEGSAEYIANRLWMDEATFNAAVEKAINGCFLDLGSASVFETEIASRGQTPYLCGHLIHLAAELASVAQDGDDVLSLWRSIYEASEPAREYDSALFLQRAEAIAGDDFMSIFALLEQGLTEADRQTLVARLNALGATIRPMALGESAGGGSAIASKLLLGVLSSHCEGRYGFSRYGAVFQLDTDDRCGEALGGNPSISALNGLPLTGDPVALVQTVRERCADEGTLLLGTENGQSLPALPCPAAVSTLPTPFKVVASGDLPAL
ncbi:MAG: hypothetical protein AAGH19_02910 [Pseudomonadota bacterium]